MTRSGMRVVPTRGNTLSGFTAYKVYEIISGTGETNMSSSVMYSGIMKHSENSANVLDDNGEIRFITMSYFREFKLDSGALFQ
ncbi:hypothetical protein PP101_08 [Pectobacterium phage PP101]|uniref:Uncharacterized protein n=1 Tax=Pectobacterium phage PP101 TaxID=1916414 RepID=A0A1J0MFE2_9CAUD|nr:hypothetical protein HOR42_gp08 [Pectobacterium phage PP101]APD19674.2 hypothetical protein PP101_08 [Pectobacterium phage PP101]